MPHDRVGHCIIAPVFLRGIGYRFYSIDALVNPDTGNRDFLLSRWLRPPDLVSEGGWSPRIALAGSGGMYLAGTRHSWERDLLRLVNAHQRRRLSDHFIADRLAALNYKAHQHVPETVGPRSIVVWRRRPGTNAPGTAHATYTGETRDQGPAGFPTISNGLDIRAVGRVSMDYILERIADGHSITDALQVDPAEMNRRLGRETWEPDDTLR